MGDSCFLYSIKKVKKSAFLEKKCLTFGLIYVIKVYKVKEINYE